MSDPCAGSQVHDCPKRLFATGRGADSNHEVEEAHCDGDVRKEDSAGEGENLQNGDREKTYLLSGPPHIYLNRIFSLCIFTPAQMYEHETQSSMW